MSPDAAVTERAAGLLAELATAARDPDPALLNDVVVRALAEMQRNPLLGSLIMFTLTRFASIAWEHACQTEDGGDWPTTVARIRERLR